jgi:ribose transport system substrate-binding protein
MLGKHGRTGWLIGALALVSLIGAGCGSGDDDNAALQTPSKKPLKIAFLDGVTANPYVKASIGAMQDTASKENVELTVIDSGFDPQKQFNQLQDLVAAKNYDGIVILPINGTALQPLVKQAIEAGIKIGSTDLPFGPDNTTTEIQIPGVSVSVLRPFSVHGEIMAKLANEACNGVSQCETAFVVGVKASPFDQQLLKSFKENLDPNVKVVAEGEGGYSREGGQTAVATILQAHRDLDVIATVDQSAVGAEPAIEAAGLTGKVKIIGYGGTHQAKEAVAAGRWFGDSAAVPATEGRLAFEGVIDALRSGKTTGGLDAVVHADVPANGMITKDNADQFKSEYAG